MKKPLVLGADPEFLFTKNKQLLRANEVVLERECGFGYDGAGGLATIGEIRPGYSSDIMEMIAKIETIFIQAERKLPNMKKIDGIVAGHYKWEQAIGGHIHIAYPSIGTNLDMRDSVGRTLDYYLLDCLEDLIAPKQEREQRISNSGGRYGRPYSINADTVRTKDNSRIEYRAPGSWLIAPEVAYTYFYVVKSVLSLHDMGKTYREILPEKKLSGMRGRINALKDLSRRANIINHDYDMGMGRDIMVDVIEGDELDWEEDIRKNWIG